MGQKYKQQGYQDQEKPQRQSGQASSGGTRREGPRAPRMTSFHGVMRCKPCGKVLPPTFDKVLQESTCPACNAALHTCTHCSFLDPSQRYECAKPIPRRISPKDAANSCQHFEAQTTVEKKTTSNPDHEDPRDAFERLFKS